MTDRYIVQVDDNGCRECGHERTYEVRDTATDTGLLGQSFSDEEDASEIAEALNDAFWAARDISAIEADAIVADIIPAWWREQLPAGDFEDISELLRRRLSPRPERSR